MEQEIMKRKMQVPHLYEITTAGLQTAQVGGMEEEGKLQGVIFKEI